MTTYTTLTDAVLAQDKPLTQSIVRAFRDNVNATAEGSSGSPSIIGLNPDAVAVASNSASLIFTNLPALDLIEFEMLGILPSSTGAVLRAQVSINNGSSYIITNYSFAKTITEISTGNTPTSSAEGGYSVGSIDISRAAGVYTSGNAGLSGIFQAFNFGSTTYTKNYNWQISHVNGTSAAPSVVTGGGVSGTVTASQQINAIKFFFGSGNIASGKITMRSRRATVAN